MQGLHTIRLYAIQIKANSESFNFIIVEHTGSHAL